MRVQRQALVLCMLLGACISLSAQLTSHGSISGSVQDTTGAAVAGARVEATAMATGSTRETLTDDAGHFRLDLLPAGEYDLAAEAKGMARVVRRGLHVEVGATVELTIPLAVAPARETVTVEGETPLVDTQPAAAGTLVDAHAIEELPLNGRRFADLALLAPGVTQDPRGLTSSSQGDLSFGGVRGLHTSYVVDGADHNNGFFAQARGRYRAPYQFSNDTIQEFRVSSNTYGAELGRAGGAVINVVTRSGSNHLRGRAFYYLRDSAFHARHPFTDVKPSDRQHQFGFTVGGPLRRNRVFFFGGFDQHRFRVPTVVRFSDGSSQIVPTPDDYESNDEALVRAAADRLNQQAGEFRSSMVGNAVLLKLDVSLSAGHHLNLRLNSSRYSGVNNVFLDPASPVTDHAVSDNGSEVVTTESLLASLTSALSYRAANHLRAQYSRDVQRSSANSSDPLTKLEGILEGMGRSTILPRRTRERRLYVAETLSYDAGRHALKFGGDAVFTWTRNWFPMLFGGEYLFRTVRVNPWTFQPQAFGLELTPLRAYAHGVPRYYIQNFGSSESRPETSSRGSRRTRSGWAHVLPSASACGMTGNCLATRNCSRTRYGRARGACRATATTSHRAPGLP